MLKSLLMGTVIAVTSLSAFVTESAFAKDITVSSKIDTEGTLLGNVIFLALRANGIKVIDRLSLGGTPVVRKAIMAGEIDIYPEYTGNAAFFFNKSADSAWRDMKQGYELAKKLDYDANKIVWLANAPANNTWALAIRQEVASANQIKTLSDFGKWVAGGGKVKLVASTEFVTAAGALPAFQSAYGFSLKPEQMTILSGGDTAATIKAAADQTDGINTAMVYGTDGAIEAAGLVVMEDDKAVQQIYAPAPLVREQVLKDNPKIAEILAPIFAKLDGERLRKLNARIQVDGETGRAVAESFLRANGFIQ